MNYQCEILEDKMDKSKIKVTCFAGLRKFFDSEVTLEIELPISYGEITQQLKDLNPEASVILNNCRIAVNETFVKPTEILSSNRPIFLIPPSSGG